MLGKPKYDYGDIVTFRCDGQFKTGIVSNIDKYGTFFDNSAIYYDLLNKDENILYKHVHENSVIEKIGRVNENLIFV